MKKSIVTFATVAVVGFSSYFTIDTVHAETTHELYNRQAQIQNQHSEVSSKLSDAEEEIADVLMDLKKMNQEIQQVEQALQSNQKMIADTNDQIDKKKKEIAELQDEIDKRYEILGNRMKNYQKNGGNIGFLDVIFGSDSFTDFISRVTAVNKITTSDADLVNQLEDDKKTVAAKLDELSELQSELEGMQDTILAQKEQNEAKKKELNKKETTLQAKIDDLKMEESSLASIEADVNRQLAAKRAASNPVALSRNVHNSNDGSLTQLSKAENNTPAVSSNAVQIAMNAGYPYLGTPYVWGGKGPGGFDCSGFVSWAYRQAGVYIPSSTSGLQYTGTKVSYSNIKPGDLVFFNTYKTNGHVGIYIGNGEFIGSQNSGLGIASINEPYWSNRFSGHVRRVVN